MHYNVWTFFCLAAFSTLTVTLLWFLCIGLESGAWHNFFVSNNLIIGFCWFLFSELILFVSVFWAYLDRALRPPVQVGAVWPPFGLEPLNKKGLPLLNTFILLRRRVTLTVSHKEALSSKNPTIKMILTTILGGTFLVLQQQEYHRCPFSIRDTIYGSCFFLGTGLHIFHVLIGTTWLLINTWAFKACLFSPKNMVGFELGALYWHFVDVVWISLFLLFY